MNNDEIDDLAGYVAMVNDDGTEQHGCCGCMIVALVFVAILFCIASGLLG